MKVLLVDQIAVVNYKYTFSLVNALKQCGNEVEVVIDDKKDNDYCQCSVHNRFLTSRKDIGKVKKLLNYILSYVFLTKKALQESFDVVHLQWLQFSPVDFLFIWLLRKKGVKVVMTVHDILPFNEKKYDFYFHKKIYRMCNQIIVQAETNIQRFKELFPENANKLSCIPHGHFLDFADIHDKECSRKKLNIPQDKMVFLFFGQIKKVKGVGVLLEAFGKLCKKRNDVFLIVAGNVWKDDFSQYRKISNRYNLKEDKIKYDIRFIPDDEIGFYYSACDMAVLPYLDVYQSGVIQLAYAHNKPAIASSIPAFMEIVEHFHTGLLCEPGKDLDLLMKMEDALNNRNQLLEWGKEGLSRIKKKYSWDDIADRISALYKK